MKKIKFKNVLATSVLLGTFAIGNSVSAAGASSILKDLAGTTPKDFTYFLDKTGENIHLALTSDKKKQSELLLTYAKERLAESQVLTAEGETQYNQQLINAYSDTLAKAEDSISEAVNDDETNEQEKEDLTSSLEEVADTGSQLDDSITGELNEKEKTELEEGTDSAKVVANVVAGLDKETVKSLREQDFGYGEIAKITALADATGKSTDEIIAMLKGGKGFGEIAKELGLKSGQLSAAVKVNRIEAELEKAKQEGNEKKVAQLQEKLTKLNEKQNSNKDAEHKKEDSLKEDPTADDNGTVNESELNDDKNTTKIEDEQEHGVEAEKKHSQEIEKQNSEKKENHEQKYVTPAPAPQPQQPVKPVEPKQQTVQKQEDNKGKNEEKGKQEKKENEQGHQENEHGNGHK